MSDYSVAFSGFASTSTKVTAETPQAAIDMAEPYVSLCHQCAREAEIGDEWEPVEVIDLDTGDVVWTAPDTQEQATDYLDKLAKARNVIERIRALHNAAGARLEGFPKATEQVIYCTYCQEAAPCTTIKILNGGD